MLAFRLWATILRSIPKSRLRVLGGAGEESWQLHKSWFDEEGVIAQIGFVPFQRRSEYMRLFGRIDVALDTFPYAGCTTTCDALWMGVPVVSRFGRSLVSRVGLSMLSQVGLQDLAVETEAEYVASAVRLASDAPRLAGLRRSLRDRFRQSPLGNPTITVAAYEAALRFASKDWCSRQNPRKSGS